MRLNVLRRELMRVKGKVQKREWLTNSCPSLPSILRKIIRISLRRKEKHFRIFTQCAVKSKHCLRTNPRAK